MVGKRGQRNTDYKAQAFRENFEYEYSRKVFSLDYGGRRDLFENLNIWKEEK